MVEWEGFLELNPTRKTPTMLISSRNALFQCTWGNSYLTKMRRSTGWCGYSSYGFSEILWGHLAWICWCSFVLLLLLFLVFLCVLTFYRCCFFDSPYNAEMNREWTFFVPGWTAPSHNLFGVCFSLCSSDFPRSLQGSLCGCASDIFAALEPSLCWHRGGMSHHEERLLKKAYKNWKHTCSAVSVAFLNHDSLVKV